MANQSTVSIPAQVISPAELLHHWQGHRQLTRRVIVAFPEDKLFSYSIGGMRTFAQLAEELTGLADGGITGIATGSWPQINELFHHSDLPLPATKEEILQQWDAVTEKINALFPQIPLERFHDVEKAFGMYEGPVYASLLYLIDNEIHHRGQGYVYLRSLGIEPPPFWDRP
jgi:uncharacterized damage-inducible protein DinB